MSTHSPQKTKRSAGITILFWLLLLSALLNLAVGILSIYASEYLESGGQIPILAELEDEKFFTERGEFFVEGIWYSVIGVVQLVIAVGFARQRRWAWVMAMTWQAVKLLVEVAAAFVGGGNLITMLFAILIVFLLNQSDVRRAFGILPKPDESSTPPLRALDIN